MMTIEQKKTALYELVGNTYQAINQAVAITTSSSEQTQAISTFCERVDALTTIESDANHWHTFCDIAKTAVQIVQAMGAGQVTIVTGWQGGAL